MDHKVIEEIVETQDQTDLLAHRDLQDSQES